MAYSLIAEACENSRVLRLKASQLGFLTTWYVCSAMTPHICGTLVAQSLPQCLPSGLAKLNLDLLVRFDNVYNVPDRNDIHRARVWLRPGFDVSPTGWLRVGARGSFAKSTNRNDQNIPQFDNFHSDDVSLDRLYLAGERGRLEMCGGKFAMPFRVSEMIWDQDIQPLGVYAAYSHPLFTVRGGVFHRSHIHHDRSTIAVGQLTLVHNLSANWFGETDAAFFSFHNLNQFQPGMHRQNRAHLVNDHEEYLSAFELAVGRFRAEYRRFARWPGAIESSVVYNLGAKNERGAVEVVAQIGKLEQRGDWQFSYRFQHVGRDAVVGAFSSDDWWYHSDFQGSRVTAAFRFLSHTFFQVGAVFQKRNGTVNLVKRLQFDLGMRF